MGTTTKARGQRKAREHIRPIMERLAEGEPVDEGERATDWEGLHPETKRFARDRPARVEWDAEARLWLIENADDIVPAEFRAALRAAIQAARAKKDYVELQRIATTFESPDWVPRSIDPEDVIEYEPDGDARDLAGDDFYTAVVRGAAELVEKGWSRHNYPELECLRKMAENESGWRRATKSDSGERSSQEVHYHKLYNRYERRYRYQARKIRAEQKKQREATSTRPV
jgi:hypothetical protein